MPQARHSSSSVSSGVPILRMVIWLIVGTGRAERSDCSPIDSHSNCRPSNRHDRRSKTRPVPVQKWDWVMVRCESHRRGAFRAEARSAIQPRSLGRLRRSGGAHIVSEGFGAVVMSTNGLSIDISIGEHDIHWGGEVTVTPEPETPSVYLRAYLSRDEYVYALQATSVSDHPYSLTLTIGELSLDLEATPTINHAGNYRFADTRVYLSSDALKGRFGNEGGVGVVGIRGCGRGILQNRC